MRWAAAPILGTSDSYAESTTAIGTRPMAHGAFLKDEPCSRPGVTPPMVSPTRNPEAPEV